MFGLSVREVAKMSGISRYAAGLTENRPVPLAMQPIAAREAVHALFETMAGIGAKPTLIKARTGSM
jgi:hypothetical protein